MTAEELINFMKWQNRHAKRLIRMPDYKIANEYLEKVTKAKKK